MWTAGGGAGRTVEVEGKVGTPVHWEDARVVILTNIFFDEVALSFVVKMSTEPIDGVGKGKRFNYL